MYKLKLKLKISTLGPVSYPGFLVRGGARNKNLLNYTEIFFFSPFFLGFAHFYNTSKNFGGGLKPLNQSILGTPLIWSL